jgi:hypothetical protein
MSAPAYQAITEQQIPCVALPGNVGTVRVIAGQYGVAKGAARTFSSMNVLDMRLNAGGSLSLDLPAGHTTALFVLHGTIRIDTHTVRSSELAVMERDGAQLAFDTMADTVLLLLSGEPLNEPIVGHGPFVMNTREEIVQAMSDYGNGKFGRMASSG